MKINFGGGFASVPVKKIFSLFCGLCFYAIVAMLILLVCNGAYLLFTAVFGLSIKSVLIAIGIIVVLICAIIHADKLRMI